MPIIAIEEDHWAQIMTIQAQAYRSIAPESLETLQSKWRHSPSNCFVFEQGGELIAYLLAHSWNSFEPPKLYSALSKNVEGKILFLHDLAVMHTLAGQGVGKQLVEHFLAHAQTQGLSHVLLVAIQGSHVFWEKFGFTSQDQTPANKIYGTGAIVMVKTLHK